ncbi:hypothetical protein [Williamsia sterculiae]|uniref:hypothetical protein n=1 Tax=Williamsia sterculiae TaxID=1344003 RepID=UPI00117F2B16|nr:hypothetical protein [Williamsia sterculiae]
MSKQFDDADKAEDAGNAALGLSSTGIAQSSSPTITLSAGAVNAQRRFDAAKGSLPAQIDAKLVQLGWGDYNIKTAPITNSSVNMTPQQIIDRNFAQGVWLQTNSDKGQALSDIGLAIQPETELYSAMSADISKGKVQSDPEVVVSSKRFDNGHYENNGLTIDSDDRPTVLIATTGIFHGGNTIQVYQYDETRDRKSGEWRQTQTIEKDRPGWFDPANLDKATIQE